MTSLLTLLLIAEFRIDGQAFLKFLSCLLELLVSDIDKAKLESAGAGENLASAMHVPRDERSRGIGGTEVLSDDL